MSGTARVSATSWYASMGPPAAISPMIGRLCDSLVIDCGVSSGPRPIIRAAWGVNRIARDWAAPRSR